MAKREEGGAEESVVEWNLCEKKELTEVRKTQLHCQKMLSDCQDLLESSQGLMKECKELLSFIKTQSKQECVVSGNLEHHDVLTDYTENLDTLRQSNRVWRMYGNAYKPIFPITYPFIPGLSPAFNPKTGPLAKK